MKRRVAIAVAATVALVAGLVAAPRRYEVDGVSMGPALLPGDVVTSGWLPDLDRCRGPRRFENWIMTLPDGSTGLKRVVGLPGEVVSLDAGDLVVDGRIVLKGPRVLAETGSRLDAGAAAGIRTWSLSPVIVLDEAPFATDEVSRLLLPVRDVGFAAVVRVRPDSLRSGPVRVRATAGPLAVTWGVRAAGRIAFVAGRLDGHAVAAAWPVPDDGPGTGRRCLPAGVPERWAVAEPWPAAGDVSAGNLEDRSPPLAIEVSSIGDQSALVETVAGWRDVSYRTAADGVRAWPLGPAGVFLLGDFPSGSRDSRHFGPLPRTALRHRSHRR